VPTAKNGMVKDFYLRFGFETLTVRPDGASEFALAVADYTPAPVWIEVVDPAASAVAEHA